MRLVRHIVWAWVGIAVGVGGLGCGDGDDSGGAPDGAPSEATPNVEAAADSASGTLVVVADASVQAARPCAAATNLVAAPDEIAVGHSITLKAAGLDPNDLSTDVTLTWSATGDVGSFSDSSGTTVSFLCTKTGTTVVTVTAAISDGGATCPTNGSLAATLLCSLP